MLSRAASALYTPSAYPTIPGGESFYLRAELDKIAASIRQLAAHTPQAATSAPSNPPDGLQRLARAPWRPVSGQTTDAWVFWDAVAKAWALL